MGIEITNAPSATIITFDGRLDSSTIAEVEAEVLPLAQPGCRLLLDMNRLNYVSSAGLRTLLLLSRKVADNGGVAVLAGLPEELRDTMEITGFLSLFAVYDNRDAGLAALNQRED